MPPFALLASLLAWRPCSPQWPYRHHKSRQTAAGCYYHVRKGSRAVCEDLLQVHSEDVVDVYIKRVVHFRGAGEFQGAVGENLFSSRMIGIFVKDTGVVGALRRLGFSHARMLASTSEAECKPGLIS